MGNVDIAHIYWFIFKTIILIFLSKYLKIIILFFFHFSIFEYWFIYHIILILSWIIIYDASIQDAWIKRQFIVFRNKIILLNLFYRFAIYWIILILFYKIIRNKLLYIDILISIWNIFESFNTITLFQIILINQYIFDIIVHF